MKRYPPAALLLLFTIWPSVFTGCIDEDLSACRWPDNLVLEFQLETAVGTDILEKLSSVDVLLFDSRGIFVDRQRLEQADLEAFRGARFSVFPGDYMVVSWANVASGSRLSALAPGVSSLSEGFVEMTEAGDSLYYAPAKLNSWTGQAALRAATGETEADDPYALHRVHVPSGGGQVVKELPFTRAYRSVNIYIRGAERMLTSTVRDNQVLSVEAANLAARYDLMFNTVASARRSYTRLCAETLTPQGRMQAVRFFSAYGPITNDIAFSLGNLPEDVPPLAILLADFLRINPPANLDDIDIMVEFLGGIPGTMTGVEISITAPDWSGSPVHPVY
jgi:hypothetical protein